MLTDTQWRQIEDFIPVLNALKCATTALSADTNVSISVAYPVANDLIVAHLTVSEDDSVTVSNFKETVSASLKRRLMSDADFATKLPVISCALDPRHKQLKFLTPSQRLGLKEYISAEMMSTAQASTPSSTSINESNGATSDNRYGM
jgi:hypothetical protein